MDSTSFVKLRFVVSEIAAHGNRAQWRGGNSASQGIHVSARPDAGRVRVDAGGVGLASAFLMPRPEPGDREWGVHIARRLASEWGMKRVSGGAIAWVELPIEADHQTDVD